MQSFRGETVYWIVALRSSILKQFSASRSSSEGLGNSFADMYGTVRNTVQFMSSCGHQTKSRFSPLCTKILTTIKESRCQMCDSMNDVFELKRWTDGQKRILDRTRPTMSFDVQHLHTTPSFLTENRHRLSTAWFGLTPLYSTSALKENMQHIFISTGLTAKLSDSAKKKAGDSKGKDDEEKLDPSLEVLMSSSTSALKTVKVVPGKGPPPEPPVNCCMSGCANCVWILYAEELKDYYSDGGKVALEAIERIENPSLKAFLKLELDL